MHYFMLQKEDKTERNQQRGTGLKNIVVVICKVEEAGSAENIRTVGLPGLSAMGYSALMGVTCCVGLRQPCSGLKISEEVTLQLGLSCCT